MAIRFAGAAGSVFRVLDDVRRLLSRASTRGAPGPDGISAGLWKTLIPEADSKVEDCVTPLLAAAINAFWRLKVIPGALNSQLLKVVPKASTFEIKSADIDLLQQTAKQTFVIDRSWPNVALSVPAPQVSERLASSTT